MTWHDTSYRNRPKNLPREVGRIHRDLAAMDDAQISKLSSNLHAIPSAPITTSEGAGAACCCDRVIYVSKDGNGDFDTIQEAINDIAAYENPSATEPWVVYICPGEYVEDVVGADYVSLVGIGTKKDAARIIGVDGPTYTCPDAIHSVENVLFRLAVDAGTVTPVVIYAVDAPATANENHIFSNCQIEMTTEVQAGELLRVSGTEITFEHCDFIYDNTAATLGANTHNLFNIVGAGDLRVTSCRIEVTIEDETDVLNVFYEAPNYTIPLNVKDCKANIWPTHASARGTYSFYNASGDGEKKYVQDNHVKFTTASVAGNIAYFIFMPVAKLILVTSNNNVVLYNMTTPRITSIAATNTLNSHHDEFIDLRTGIRVPYANLGTFNYVHSPMPGKHHISQHQDIDLPPGGSFFLAANQAGFTPGGWRTVFITGVSWQKGGTAPVAPTYRYVPGVVGKYLVIANAVFLNTTVTEGHRYQVGIARNGVVIRYCMNSAPFWITAGGWPQEDYMAVHVSAIIDISSTTDFLNLQILHTSGANQTLRGTAATTFLEVHKIS